MREHSTACEPVKPLPLTEPSICASARASGGFQTCPAQRGGLGVAEGDVLKLDTRILEGNPLYIPYRPAILSYDSSEYRNRPINYPIYEKPLHFRAKVQAFSTGGFETVITAINMQRLADIAMLKRPRGKRTERKGDDESLEKSRRRTKKTVRFKCKELGVDHLVTLTTRKETLTRDELQASFGRFTDRVSYHLGRKLEYVAVVEPHPTNPGHLHIHLAIRGRLSMRDMVIFRQSWYVALGGTGKEKGPDAPGGFNIKEIKVRGGAHRRTDKIAHYISKYITKNLCEMFNKKRYWATKIDLLAARTYWLKAQTIGDAMAEFLRDFPTAISDVKTDFFQARNIDLIWMRSVPDKDVEYEVPF